MSLAHLTKDELAVWNKLDKEVGRLLKSRSNDFAARESIKFDVLTAAALRDKIGRPTLLVSDRARYVQEARDALRTGEWHNSSIHGGEC